ncbi:MAG: radical SAM protein [Chlorobiales bacterium]|nr:radical SAM protein [Chlorobiales bacterium]
MLKVNEIFYSIQGESSKAGWPCVFVRLAGCDLRCTYCDTGYAFYDGTEYSCEAILEKVRSFGCNLVEITGGEPLLQEDVYPLMKTLCDFGYEVLLETGGHIVASRVDQRVRKIIDMKAPSSAMTMHNAYQNLELAVAEASKGAAMSEIKFVLGSRADYEWAKEVIEKYALIGKVEVLMSVVFEAVSPRELAEWVLADRLNVRVQLQLHKFIWSPDTRGV